MCRVDKSVKINKCAYVIIRHYRVHYKESLDFSEQNNNREFQGLLSDFSKPISQFLQQTKKDPLPLGRMIHVSV